MTTTAATYEKILQCVRHIPSGRVASYGQIAELAGLPGRARMVGKVLGYAPADNPVPWHRVLRSSGQLAFPPGSTTAELQTRLLSGEHVTVTRNKVAMKTYRWQPSLDDIFSLNPADTPL